MLSRRMRRWLGWAALLIGLYFLVSGFMLARALDRILVTGRVLPASAPRPVVTDPLTPGYRGDPRQAFGFPYHEVSYPSPLGSMPAWLVPATPAAAPDLAAVYVHGLGGNRDNGFRYLPTLHAAGVPVMLIAYRNDTGAPADPSGRRAMGLTEWRDLDAAVAWMRGRGHRRLILIGDSMGGAIVGEWLQRSRQADAATALILDAPALDTPAMVEAIARLRHLPAPGLVADVTLAFLDLRTGLPLSTARSDDAVARFAGPLLLAHGAPDTAVPVGISDRLERRRRVGTVYLRGKAGHLQMFAEDPARFTAAQRRLVETAIRRNISPAPQGR